MADQKKQEEDDAAQLLNDIAAIAARGERPVVVVMPTPGTSFDEDMRQRDETAKTFDHLAAMGCQATVTLHADLSNKEIERAVARYKGRAVKFVLVDTDSTPEERADFMRRWKRAGGGEVGDGVRY